MSDEWGGISGNQVIRVALMVKMPAVLGELIGDFCLKMWNF